MPARTSRLRANAAPAALELPREVRIGAHCHALETIRVVRWDRERAPSVATRRSVAGAGQGLAQVGRGAGVVPERVGEQLHGLRETSLEHSLRALELGTALGGRELGEGAMRGAVRLDRDTASHELTEVLPIAERLLGLALEVEEVAAAHEVRRHEEHRRIAEALEPRQRDMAHRAVAVVEGYESRALRQPFRLGEPEEEGGQVDWLPATVPQHPELLGEGGLGNVEPRLPAAGRRRPDLVVAEDRDPAHASVSSRARRTTFSPSKCSSASSRARREWRP